MQFFLSFVIKYTILLTNIRFEYRIETQYLFHKRRRITDDQFKQAQAMLKWLADEQ